MAVLGDYIGYVYCERRWRTRRGDRLYTWDNFHGEVEAFDTRGEHSGVLDAVTGEPIKPARPGRRIRV
jgi:hypothetical protein